ncbi:hypothetical protein GQ44DRAFT_708379 [Phaeosphaeriaceae sp. PMI808]|nr:hypothetical protein GQ44DRAFT_708379 [Phaeosphaeriaceae sp. PMI808]
MRVVAAPSQHQQHLFHDDKRQGMWQTQSCFAAARHLSLPRCRPRLASPTRLVMIGNPICGHM